MASDPQIEARTYPWYPGPPSSRTLLFGVMELNLLWSSRMPRGGPERTIVELQWRPEPCPDYKWPPPWLSSSPSPGLFPLPQSESARRPECQPYVSDARLPHSEPEGLFGNECSVKAVFIHTRARRLFIMQNYTLPNTQASKGTFPFLGESATWAV